MEKQAYEDDAVVTLNRQKGHYFSGRERADGVDDGTLLRDACEQLLAAQRAGIKFALSWGNDLMESVNTSGALWHTRAFTNRARGKQ